MKVCMYVNNIYIYIFTFTCIYTLRTSRMDIEFVYIYIHTWNPLIWNLQIHRTYRTLPG